MIYINIQFGIYGMLTILFLEFLNLIIQKRKLYEIVNIRNLIMGFIMGSVGKLIFDTILKELYPIAPATAICLLYSFILSVLLNFILAVFNNKSYTNVGKIIK